MALIPVNAVGEHGVILDRKPHELPLNAWSSALNVRFRDNYAEKFLGEATYVVPSIVPYFLLPVPTDTDYFWLYAGLNKVYAFDGVTHSNITRQSVGVDVNYAATAALNWTGGLLNGTPILNNGVDLPQMWLPTNTSTKLSALTNWNANHTCRAMRPFKSFLVALDITKTGIRYPHMVKWSHPADTGSIPASWDETDPTKDAGEYSLAETSGYVVDSVPLRDVNIVYKEDAIYLMQYIGGVYIFRFSALSKIIGILSRRCAVEFTPGHHAAFCVGDVVRHDGQQVQSIVDAKTRKWLFDNIDGTAYEQCFVVNYATRQEVWFCFPTLGSSIPNRAMVWNWGSNTITFRQLNDVSHIATGLLTEGFTPWDSRGETWDAASGVWDVRPYSPTALSLVQARTSATLLSQAESTNDFTGAAMTSTLERTGITVPFKAGQPPDFSTYKFLRSLWPRIEGTDGGQIMITVGTQQQIDGAVTWESPVTYTIGTTNKIDCRCAGRLLAVRFESNTSLDWRLHGYEMDIQFGGRF